MVVNELDKRSILPLKWVEWKVTTSEARAGDRAMDERTKGTERTYQADATEHTQRCPGGLGSMAEGKDLHNAGQEEVTPINRRNAQAINNGVPRCSTVGSLSRIEVLSEGKLRLECSGGLDCQLYPESATTATRVLSGDGANRGTQAMDKVEKGTMRGQAGGLKTRDNHAEVCPVCGSLVFSSYYRQLGRSGGVSLFRQRGREHMSEIGRMGGRPRKGNGSRSGEAQPGGFPPPSTQASPLLFCKECGCEFADARGKGTEAFGSIACPRCLNPVRR